MAAPLSFSSWMALTLSFAFLHSTRNIRAYVDVYVHFLLYLWHLDAGTDLRVLYLCPYAPGPIACAMMNDHKTQLPGTVL